MCCMYVSVFWWWYWLALGCWMIYWGFSCTNTSKIKRENIYPNGHQFFGQKVYSEVLSSEYCPWLCPSLYDHSIPIFSGCFQQAYIPCHTAQIISSWCLEHYGLFNVLKWSPHSPALTTSQRAPLGCGVMGVFNEKQICNKYLML